MDIIIRVGEREPGAMMFRPVEGGREDPLMLGGGPGRETHGGGTILLLEQADGIGVWIRRVGGWLGRWGTGRPGTLVVRVMDMKIDGIGEKPEASPLISMI